MNKPRSVHTATKRLLRRAAKRGKELAVMSRLAKLTVLSSVAKQKAKALRRIVRLKKADWVSSHPSIRTQINRAASYGALEALVTSARACAGMTDDTLRKCERAARQRRTELQHA